ncbi:hypothetical protein MTO96_013418 [Rhipicephalus appendiculatus]
MLPLPTRQTAQSPAYMHPRKRTILVFPAKLNHAAAIGLTADLSRIGKACSGACGPYFLRALTHTRRSCVRGSSLGTVAQAALRDRRRRKRYTGQRE